MITFLPTEEAPIPARQTSRQGFLDPSRKLMWYPIKGALNDLLQEGGMSEAIYNRADVLGDKQETSCPDPHRDSTSESVKRPAKP